MDLVFHKVGEFHHVDDTNRYLVLEGFAGATIIQDRLPRARKIGLLEIVTYLIPRCAVEDRCSEVHT